MRKVILESELTLDSLTEADIIIVTFDRHSPSRVVQTSKGFMGIYESTFFDIFTGSKQVEKKTIKSLIEGYNGVKEVLVFEDIAELKEWMNPPLFEADKKGMYRKIGILHYRDLVRGDRVRRTAGVWDGAEFEFDGVNFALIEAYGACTVGSMIYVGTVHFKDYKWEYI